MMIFGYCCLVFALVVYVTNFKEVNKDFVLMWKALLKEGREQYFLEHYPYGYYLLKPFRGTDIYYQPKAKQQCYLDTLYNRKMLLR